MIAICMTWKIEEPKKIGESSTFLKIVGTFVFHIDGSLTHWVRRTADQLFLNQISDMEIDIHTLGSTNHSPQLYVACVRNFAMTFCLIRVVDGA